MFFLWQIFYWTRSLTAHTESFSHIFIHSVALSHSQHSQSFCSCCSLCSLTAAAGVWVPCSRTAQWQMMDVKAWLISHLRLSGRHKKFIRYFCNPMTVVLNAAGSRAVMKFKWTSSGCFCFRCCRPQALQALGYVLGSDGDVDSLSADEKSDGEGKNDRMSTSSSSTSITSSTDTQEVRNEHTHTQTMAFCERFFLITTHPWGSLEIQHNKNSSADFRSSWLQRLETLDLNMFCGTFFSCITNFFFLSLCEQKCNLPRLCCLWEPEGQIF